MSLRERRTTLTESYVKLVADAPIRHLKLGNFVTQNTVDNGGSGDHWLRGYTDAGNDVHAQTWMNLRNQNGFNLRSARVLVSDKADGSSVATGFNGWRERWVICVYNAEKGILTHDGPTFSHPERMKVYICNNPSCPRARRRDLLNSEQTEKSMDHNFCGLCKRVVRELN